MGAVTSKSNGPKMYQEDIGQDSGAPPPCLPQIMYLCLMMDHQAKQLCRPQVTLYLERYCQ